LPFMKSQPNRSAATPYAGEKTLWFAQGLAQFAVADDGEIAEPREPDDRSQRPHRRVPRMRIEK
jgi:hypothetical protein